MGFSEPTSRIHPQEPRRRAGSAKPGKTALPPGFEGIVSYKSSAPRILVVESLESPSQALVGDTNFITRIRACERFGTPLIFAAVSGAIKKSASDMTHFVAHPSSKRSRSDAYFSADIETDGPIPGPFSMLSFALVYAGTFDGNRYDQPKSYECTIYKELKPISLDFEREALEVNGLDRSRLQREGLDPVSAMTSTAKWVKDIAGDRRPVLVAFPLSFDWTWLYWYFVRYSELGSPFNHSSCFDIKTAFAVKSHLPIAQAGKAELTNDLKSSRAHTHNALDDAIEQAEIFAKLFLWEGVHGRHSGAETT